jgi:predicted nuclease of predicted toxin-antitoxin system
MNEEPASGRRVLLDEMLPRLLARELPGHDVMTVADASWRGLLNGELLRQAEDAGIEVFVTADRKMEHQQRLTGRKFGVVVLIAGGTKLETLHSVADALRDAVARAQPGELLHVTRAE